LAENYITTHHLTTEEKVNFYTRKSTHKGEIFIIPNTVIFIGHSYMTTTP